MGSFTARRKVLVRRFTLAAAALGFIAGLCEATYLYKTPLTPVMLQADTRYVIWFIAPLAGVAFLAPVGLGLGLAAGMLPGKYKGLGLYLASTGMGVVAVYTAAAINLLHFGDSALSVVTHGPTWVCFLFGFVCAFLGIKLSGRRLGDFFDAESPWPLWMLTRGVMLAIAVTISGLVFYYVSRSVPWTPVLRNHAVVSKRSPNIVLITLDTTRADHLSAYGYARPTTPHLDQFALRGVLFENAIAPSSWTLASHASIFTELLPHQHGAYQAGPLGPGPWTLAKVLRDRGYETAGFSSNNAYGYAGYGLANGFEVYEDDSFSLRHNLIRTMVGWDVVNSVYHNLVHFVDFAQRPACDVNRDVANWFARRSARPFFLFINYIDPHAPYLAPPPYSRRFGRISEDMLRLMYPMGGAYFPRPLSSDEHASLVDGYDNCLAYLDDQVGRLLQSLAASPEWPNTIVIITSDHGEAFGEHDGRYFHGYDLNRQVLHVPLILAGPGIPAGQRISHIVRIRELFQTVLDLALGEKEPIRRGSLRRFWTPGFKPEAYDEVVVSELVSEFPDFQPAFISLMSPEWHYIHESRGHSELYRWPVDPEEKVNLAGLPPYQGTLHLLDQQLREVVMSSFRPWRGPEYLFALDRPGFSFLRDTSFDLRLQPSLPSSILRVGASQAYYAPAPGSTPAPRPIDEELLKSLPYH